MKNRLSIVLASIGLLSGTLAAVAGGALASGMLQAPTCRTYAETGHKICGKFLTYWDQHGGLAQQGYPISDEFVEVSDLNGQPYTVQYFERAVFELHPELAAPNNVLLSQLGTFRYKATYGK